MLDRKPLDDAIVNMLSSTVYQKEALFYAHIVAQMNIKIRPDMNAPAGITFTIDHFTLYVNMELFSQYSLDDRIFILIHECLHITMGHLDDTGRLCGDHINHRNANLAEDCAINQLINMTVPKDAILPNNLLKDPLIKVKSKQNSEFYYNLLDNEPEEKQECNGDCEASESGKGDDGEPCDCNCKSNSQSNSQKQGKLIDTHETWDESTGDKDLQKDITAQLIEKAIENTLKERGTLPQNIEHMMNMFKRKAQIDWKKVLKNMVGQKKVGKRPTIMKRSRRFQNRPDIKGYTKDRMFELVVIVDISGSMSDKEIMTGLNEISAICKVFNTTIKLIQVDSVVHKIETFTAKTRIFDRNGCGGTIMETGVKYIMDENIPYDGIVFISDGYIEDVAAWNKQPKSRVLWLCTSENHEIPGVNKLPKHSQYLLKI